MLVRRQIFHAAADNRARVDRRNNAGVVFVIDALRQFGHDVGDQLDGVDALRVADIYPRMSAFQPFDA